MTINNNPSLKSQGSIKERKGLEAEEKEIFLLLGFETGNIPGTFMLYISKKE